MTDERHLVVFCEGQTEQGFCSQILQPHLFPSGEGIIHTLPTGEKDHHHLYGLGKRRKYTGDKGVRKFICNTIKQWQERNAHFTTLFDLYALPADFPGFAENVRNPANPTPFILALEAAFRNDINHHRFIPYIQLHEYETMLFSDPEGFRIAFDNRNREIEQLKAIADSEQSIENINDGGETAPSKRISSLIPEYAGLKSSVGPDIAEFIGLARIRTKCPHVHSWLIQLENLA